MDRLVRFNVIATSGRAVEAAGDVDTLLLDKTGTITFGNRMAADFIPVPGVTAEQVAEAALLASLSDETPEGRSIAALATGEFGYCLTQSDRRCRHSLLGADSSVRRRYERQVFPQGAIDAILKFADATDGKAPAEFHQAVDRIARTVARRSVGRR